MNFVHSLQHLSLVKLAVEIYTSPEVRNYEKRFVQPFYYTYNGQWEPFVREKFSSRIPFEVVQDTILGAIKPLSYELFTWKTDHWEILRSNADVKINFCWKQGGTIDRLETAKSLIHGEDFTITQRFFMACYYWLKEEAIQLWGKLSPSDFENVMLAVSYQRFGSKLGLILEIWIKWLQDGADCEKYYDICIKELLRFNRYVPPSDDLYKKLAPEYPICRALGLLDEHPRSSFCRYFLSTLNNTQQMIVFQNECSQAARLFLDWPLQHQFLEIIKCLGEHLTKENYILIFKQIVTEKIQRHFRDFNYEGLLKALWLQSSLEIKEYSRNHPEFEIFREYVRNSY
ncbi:uncharacterized protein TNIN_393611 [Trichonephila inaurata madagascariensis]|uniref:Uncharacterized protein n=1 Tax=Trichonephila inaurata madagascariensis TaxID=2747483 RepID=A0A8X6Y6C2_9ARAC|nr:uncharacterized protein TNIN_393611 [Trichonephila inaurata madagascariensis]